MVDQERQDELFQRVLADHGAGLWRFTAGGALFVLIAGRASVPGFVIIASYAGWVVWYGRKARRELKRIEGIAAEFWSTLGSCKTHDDRATT